MSTAFAQNYQQVKAVTNRQAQQVFSNGASAPVEEWTPEYVASYAENIGNIVEAAQMVVGNLTSVDMANMLEIRPIPVTSLITMRDSGIGKMDEYQRPFWEMVKASRDNKPNVLQAGERRLEMLSATDLQMAKVRQAQIMLKAAGRKTYRRVVTSDNPCELCEIASTQIYYTEDLMPIHTNCSCDVEADDTSQSDMDEGFGKIGGDGSDTSKDVSALNESGAPAADFRKLLAVRSHGEVGPMLTWAAQKFLGPQDLSVPVRTVEDSKVRQLDMQRRQLARAIEHQGTADFKRVYTTAERQEVLAQARIQAQQAIDLARAQAPAHLARIQELAKRA